MEMKDGNFGNDSNTETNFQPGPPTSNPPNFPPEVTPPAGNPSNIQGGMGPPGGYPPNFPAGMGPPAGYPPPNFQAGMGPPGGYAPPNFQAGMGPPGGYAPPNFEPGMAPPAGYPNPQGYYAPPGPGMPSPYGYQQPPPGAYQGPPGQPNYGPYGGPPIQNQPMGPGGPQPGWMPAPPADPNCPPGLEYLSMVDQILVHQQVELLEALVGYESNNKYEIKNSMGQRVYFAAEENDCCTRNFCGSARSFVMTIVDNSGREVIRLSRDYRCSSCCFPCCLQKLQVESPPGTTIGYVKQNWHPCLPKFTIQNETEEDVMKIHGPCLPCSCCSDVNFELKSLDESVIGKISKQWTGFVKEAYTDADNFGVQFPMDLDIKMKAVVLGACFLIDFMYFEDNNQKK